MNESTLAQLNALVERAVRPIRASGARRQMMREELQAHLWQSYQENLARLANEPAAIDAARQAFGDPQDIRRQLQASIPIGERILFTCLEPTENVMTRWLIWTVVIAAFIFLMNFLFPPYGAHIVLAATSIVGALAVLDMRNVDGMIARFGKPRLIGLTGCIGILFGTAVILPALARMKQAPLVSETGQDVTLLLYLALGIGTLIVLEGFCFIAYGLLSRRPRIA